MFENFSFGLLAVFLHMSSLILSILTHNITLGFAFGFLAATGIYIFLLAEEPSHIPLMLVHKPNVCFEKIAVKSDNGTFQTSYTEFQKTYAKVKILIYSAILAFLALAFLILIATPILHP